MVVEIQGFSKHDFESTSESDAIRMLFGIYNTLGNKTDNSNTHSVIHVNYSFLLLREIK